MAPQIVSESTANHVAAVVLVPTRELAEQVTQHARGFCAYCDKDIKVLNAATSDHRIERLMYVLPPFRPVYIQSPRHPRNHQR